MAGVVHELLLSVGVSTIANVSRLGGSEPMAGGVDL